MSRGKKDVTDSFVTMTYLAVPSDANTVGTVFGGRILHLMDTAAAIAARRHSNLRVVTVGVDGVRFLRPIRVGQVITLLASVNHAFHTSMEVGLKVMAEDTYKQKRFHAASAYFTLVGMDEEGKIQPVPEIKAETKDETRRSRDAMQRRETRRIADKDEKDK